MPSPWLGVASFLRGAEDEYDKYQDRKLREAALESDRKRMAAQLVTSGFEQDESGGFKLTKDEQRKRNLQEATSQAGIAKAGFLAEEDPVTGKFKLAKDPTYRDIDREYKTAQIKHLGAETEKIKHPPTNLAKQFHEGLPVENQKQIEALATKKAGRISIANSLQTTLDSLNDPNMSEEQKLVQARQAIKVLNSQEGQDAVGAEESKRLAALLEYKTFNLTEPGPFLGRAPISDFAEQIKNTVGGLRSSAKFSDESIKSLYGGGSGLIEKEPEVIKSTGQQGVGILSKAASAAKGMLGPSSAVASPQVDKVAAFMQKNGIKDRNEALRILKEHGKL